VVSLLALDTPARNAENTPANVVDTDSLSFADGGAAASRAALESLGEAGGVVIP